MLTNRLKILLSEVITPTQRTFVPGRLVIDNVLVAYESYNSIKNKTKEKHGLCAIKLDMHKAYNCVEWNFLENMMLQLGFNAGWVELIMACVRSITYQVRFNSHKN